MAISPLGCFDQHRGNSGSDGVPVFTLADGVVARGQPLRVTAKQPIQIAAGTPATLRVWHAQQNGASLIAGLRDLARLWLADVSITALARGKAYTHLIAARRLASSLVSSLAAADPGMGRSAPVRCGPPRPGTHGGSLPGQSAELSASLPVFFQGTFRRQYQAVDFERFLDKVVGAPFDGGNSCLVIAVTGDHHDRQFGMLSFEVIEQLKAVQPAAFQPNVEENEIGPARYDSGQRFVAVARRARTVSLVLQDARYQFADIRFVVNDQNVGCHGIRN